MSLLQDLLTALDAIDTLPPEVDAAASGHLLDIVGVAAAAARSSAGAPWVRHAATVAADAGRSSMIGTGHRARPADAALVNGGLMHSLEYDDTHTGAIAHGSAVLAATALAVAEAEGRSGCATLRAYAVWYEVLIRLGLSAAGGFQARGFQLTSVGGALCAAGIAATLKGLDREGVAHAVGIALSQASGVFAFLSNGATVKSMHPGWAAHAGITAAELASAGLTGPDRPFDDTFGLFRVFAGDAEGAGRLAGHVADLGRRWHLPDVAYKFVPCCHYIHPFVEAARDLTAGRPGADGIAAIRLHVPEGAAPIVCAPWEAKCRASGHAARWSLPVVVAMQIVEGRVGLESFERTPEAAVFEVAARSTWRPLADSRFPERFDALLEIETVGGEVLTRRIDDVYGNASRPPSEDAVRGKFMDNLGDLADPEAAERLAHALRHLARLDDLGEVRTLLAGISAKEAQT
ncbi:MmgE/PrpD family protein [Roseivivax isoporae]|uniref:MmgE/PrpD family protein n=1 Tax=Roseivivax isoporae LMG 25204 TaxID=1449351 RepID=X7FC67_9RHOB|nr:MmgE/PrpD family protein [Roseivivax isoporae]ETX30338.1 hypothetical protein RISW2_16005 [Roseivivax isoporae LMG 25204]